MKQVQVKHIKEAFNLVQVTGNEQSLMRPISIQDINRPGLELAGYFNHTQPLRIVLLGDKEMSYIETMMSSAKQKKSFNRIMDEKTPCIIISKGHKVPEELIKLATKRNFPIFTSAKQTVRIMTDIVSYLDEHLAEVTSLHGVFLSVFGKGVLVTGESGMGKSEIALELIKRGHLLIADDRVDVARVHNKIMGQAPMILRGMLEIRGVGIIDVTKMFGASAVLEKKEVDFVVHLDKWSDQREYARVGIEDKIYKTVMEVDIPQIILPVKEGRSMGVIIESAVSNFTLQQMGIDSAKEFEQRILSYIQNRKEENE